MVHTHPPLQMAVFRKKIQTYNNMMNNYKLQSIIFNIKQFTERLPYVLWSMYYYDSAAVYASITNMLRISVRLCYDCVTKKYTIV